MSHPNSDPFQDFDAATVTKPNALLVGITAPSFGGKTYSALELATGMQAVTGGDIFLVDTEADRALQYKDRFKFRHVPFKPPFSPERYGQAIDHCIARGAKIIIVDSMTHEHSGDGGLLDMIDDYIDKKLDGRDGDREKYKWAAQILPKRQRKRLNGKIEQLGARAIFIFCYRAEDKTKPGAGGKAVHMGWTAETTSKLPYMMTVRFLLPPASDGRPNLNPDTEFEKLSIKMPEFFRGWFKPGLQLNRELGQKLALWAAGGAGNGAGNETSAIPRSSSSSTPPAARGERTSVRLTHVSKERERLKWSKGDMWKFLDEAMPTTDPDAMSQQQWEDVTTLLKLQGSEDYEAERAALVELGRVKK